MHLNIKTCFILLSILVLNACGTVPTEPLRIPGLSEQGAGQNAYLWTSGTSWSGRSNLRDYAIITQIDDFKMPSHIIPLPGGAPVSSTLLELPAGLHAIEILYKEMTLICYLDCLYFEKSRHTLTFTAEPNRTYSPFVSDVCSEQDFWIEDWGPYVAGSETLRHTFFGNASDFTKPVVAGKAPDKGSCEQTK